MKKNHLFLAIVSLFVIFSSCSNFASLDDKNGCVDLVLTHEVFKKLYDTMNSSNANAYPELASLMNSANQSSGNTNARMINEEDSKLKDFFGMGVTFFVAGTRGYLSDLIKISYSHEELRELADNELYSKTVTISDLPCNQTYKVYVSMFAGGSSEVFGYTDNVKVLPNATSNVTVRLNNSNTHDYDVAPLVTNISGSGVSYTGGRNVIAISQYCVDSSNVGQIQVNSMAFNSYPCTVNLTLPFDSSVYYFAQGITSTGAKVPCSVSGNVASLKVQSGMREIYVIITAANKNTGYFVSNILALSVNEKSGGSSKYVLYKNSENDVYIADSLDTVLDTKTFSVDPNIGGRYNWCFDNDEDVWNIVYYNGDVSLYLNEKMIYYKTGPDYYQIAFDKVKKQLVLISQYNSGEGFYTLNYVDVTKNNDGISQITQTIDEFGTSSYDITISGTKTFSSSEGKSLFVINNGYIYSVAGEYYLYLHKGSDYIKSIDINEVVPEYISEKTGNMKLTDLCVKDGFVYVIVSDADGQSNFGGIIRLTEDLRETNGVFGFDGLKTFTDGGDSIVGHLGGTSSDFSDNSCALVGPQYFIAEKPDCLVISDHGYLIQQTETGCRSFTEPVSRVVTIHLSDLPFSQSGVSGQTVNYFNSNY